MDRRFRSARERAPLGLRLAAAAGLLYLHVPMFFILLYAFTPRTRAISSRRPA